MTVSYFGQRYVEAQNFESELKRLRIHGGFAGKGTLENWERIRLLIPKLRVQYPDPIARRMWGESHPEYGHLRGEVEPDGLRYNAAVELAAFLAGFRVRDFRTRQPHPLDNALQNYSEFVHLPAEREFVPWENHKVDVSNETHAPFYDSHITKTYYSAWQTLFAIEIEHMGIHCSINLRDRQAREAAWQSIYNGTISIPQGTLVSLRDGGRVISTFEQHVPALDSLVWFIGEENNILQSIIPSRTGRYRLTEEENERYRQAMHEEAEHAMQRYRVSLDALIFLAQFLAERWSDWKDNDRSLYAEEYKNYLGKLVQMTRVASGLNFEAIRDRIGTAGYRRPILDVIWPDWVQEESQRMERTLSSMTRRPADGVPLNATEAQIADFVRFIDDNNQHGFFWCLNSCEEHALRGNEYAVSGLRRDIQAMAVAVEQMMRALGGTQNQLYEIFRALWHDTPVGDMLNNQLRQAAITRNMEWSDFIALAEEVRGRGAAGHTAADLLIASKIRGAAHYALEEEDAWALQRLVVALLRAAFLTFIQRKNTRAADPRS